MDSADHGQVRIENFDMSGVGNFDVVKNCLISGLGPDLDVEHGQRQEGSEDLQSSHVGHLHKDPLRCSSRS